MHKDYLGSIIAISDEEGQRLEYRHYDAWGNVTHLKIGNNATITDREQIKDHFAAGKLMLERGYTSHEHFAKFGIIHMNGRLYDPLLRRFLNADENIQDAFNTQNYNKYGYVLNNPLMYNDPSGELFWFAALAVALKSVFWAGVVAGAIGGAVIGSALYLGQAFITGNFSWGGFAKSFFVGALTGAVAGGLGQVFSAGGFWSTVGNGALAGAGSGGVNAIIYGQNFLEGLAKGAVIGGAIGAVSYAIKYYTTKAGSLTSYVEDVPENRIDGNTPVGSRDYARDLYEKEFGLQDGLDKNSIYNRASPGGKMQVDGSILTRDGKSALGVTESSTVDLGFLKGKQTVHKMYLSHNAFSSREQLAFVMQHELGHVRIYNAGLSKIAKEALKLKSAAATKYSGLLDNIGHYHIQEYGTKFLEINGWSGIRSSIPSSIFNSANYQMANERIWKLLSNTAFKININFR